MAYEDVVFLKINGDHSANTNVCTPDSVSLYIAEADTLTQCSQSALKDNESLLLVWFGEAFSALQALMREWGVRAVPNFRFFRNGELVHSHSGAKEEDLRNHLSKFVAMQTADA